MANYIIFVLEKYQKYLDFDLFYIYLLTTLKNIFLIYGLILIECVAVYVHCRDIKTATMKKWRSKCGK